MKHHKSVGKTKKKLKELRPTKLESKLVQNITREVWNGMRSMASQVTKTVAVMGGGNTTVLTYVRIIQ